MFRFLINHFSPWEIFIFISIILSIFSIIIYLTLAFGFPFLSEQGAESMAILVGFLGGAYGILLGFIIVNLWQSVDNARIKISDEARAFDAIVIYSDIFPKEHRKQILDSIQNYVCLLTTDERKAMRYGHTSKKAIAAMRNIYTVVQSYTPKTPMETLYYNQVVNYLDQALKARRERVDYINSRLPAELHFILIFGAFLVIGCISVLQSAYRTHVVLRIVMLTFASIGLACNLGFALALDYPFSGSISVSFAPLTSEGAITPFAKCPPLEE